ncbi:MAG TPA: hypothetical protein VM616_09555 [Gammaproteobacteria bacterium]|nr:hypothetical protein [Gammaproteobacteria bacterium]
MYSPGSCSSLIEHEDGRLEILRWPSRYYASRGLAAAPAAA